MNSPASLLPELEDVVQHGSPGKRAETLRRITDLFLGGADTFGDEHVGLFDDVIGYLIVEIETQALAELADRIAPVPNAPKGVVRTLALNDDIQVAGPVLRQTPLPPGDLKHIAETKGDAHLLALSERTGLSEALSDVLVRRGNLEVSHSIATNQHASLSDHAFSTLIQRAQRDGVLAEKVGMRTDIPSRLFRQLLLQATDTVQKRLLARAKPETQSEIRSILAKISSDVGAKIAPRDYTAALERVSALHRDGKLNEETIVEFAEGGLQEETIAGLSTICAVPVETVDRLMSGDRYDPIIILARANKFNWETVRAIISARRGTTGITTQAIDAAQQNFELLSPATAERVVRFWQVRPAGH